MPDLVVVDVGIALDELAARANGWHGSVKVVELTRWLLEQTLVVERDGLLQPTEQAIEIGNAIA